MAMRSLLRRMPKFPVDAPKRRVVRALVALEFQIVRERQHIAMVTTSMEHGRH